MRPRGGIIGATVQPAATALNSAASGVWTLREAEALKRAGTWPVVAPGGVVTGLQLWLDASDSATLFNATTGGSLVAADGTIKRWEDKSGNGNHATEATNAPIRKTRVFNGCDTVRFDGTNALMKTGAISALNSRTMTVWVVAAQAALTANKNVLTIGYGDFSNTSVLELIHHTTAFDGAASPATCFSFARNELGVAIATPSANRFQHSAATATLLGHTVDSSGTLTSFANRNTYTGLTASSGTNAVDTPSQHQAVGIGVNQSSGITFNGDICEVIIYNTNLSTNNRNLVIDYLMAKWGIT